MMISLRVNCNWGDYVVQKNGMQLSVLSFSGYSLVLLFFLLFCFEIKTLISGFCY